MATLLQQLAEATRTGNLQPMVKRGPVSVYNPRQAVQAMQRRQQARPAAPRPAPREAAARRRGEEDVDWSAVEQAFATSPAAQRKQQQAQQQTAEEALPWYKKGLGMVLGNPVTKTLLMPLNVLGMAGKAVTLGYEEAAEHLPGMPDWAKKAMLFNPATAPLGVAANFVDTDRTEADKRSNWSKLAPNSDYGFGQLLNPDMPSWQSRPIGLAGDIALDPTTYISGGALRVAGAGAKGAKTAKAARFAEEAADVEGLLAKAGRTAAEHGDFSELGPLAARGAEAEAMARRLGAEAEQITPKLVPLHQGRKARAQFIAEFSEENPALFEKYGAELTRAGERGFNTIKDPAFREAIGLTPRGLRVGTARIPLTGGLVGASAKVGGELRAAANKAPWLGEAMAKFAPKGLEGPLGVLTRGKQGDVLRSATAVRIQNLMRRGAGNMEGRGNKALIDLVRQMKKLGGEEELRALFRQAEADDAPNILNKFFGEKLPEIYTKVAGRTMGVGRNPDTYIPHMMDPEWKRFLKEQKNPDLVKDLGFEADDLLEGSHFLEKARYLAPDEVGVPKDFDIAGRTITLTDGTVDELNGELARAFPEFKGKAYMDDPVKIGEAYVSSISRQAGRDFALGRLAESDNPLVQEVGGELLSAIETRNEWARQNPILEAAKKGYTKGQRLAPVEPKGERPATPFDDMLATTKHFEETQARARRDHEAGQGLRRRCRGRRHQDPFHPGRQPQRSARLTDGRAEEEGGRSRQADPGAQRAAGEGRRRGQEDGSAHLRERRRPGRHPPDDREPHQRGDQRDQGDQRPLRHPDPCRPGPCRLAVEGDGAKTRGSAQEHRSPVRQGFGRAAGRGPCPQDGVGGTGRKG